MTDAALEREIERALTVDPSPEFLARVRARVATEVVSPRWLIRWELVTAGIALASVLVVMMMFRPSQERGGNGAAGENAPPATLVDRTPRITTPPASTEEPSNSFPVAVPTTPALGRSVTDRAPANTPDDVTIPEVVIAPQETAGLRSLMALVSDGRFDSSVLGEQPDATTFDQADEIIIQPIAIEPLAALALVEGERQ
jgi:hypothetical protein